MDVHQVDDARRVDEPSGFANGAKSCGFIGRFARQQHLQTVGLNRHPVKSIQIERSRHVRLGAVFNDIGPKCGDPIGECGCQHVDQKPCN